MKTQVFIIAIALASAFSLKAQVVSWQEALKAAGNTFPVYEGMPQSLDKASIKTEWQMEPFPAKSDLPVMYICTRPEGGFVILSAEYAAKPVIAYSRSGSIDPGDLPPACEEWLENVRKQIEDVRKNGMEATPQIRQRWKALLSEEVPDQPDKRPFSPGISPEHSFRSVEPLITTKWGQRLPYNQFCPVDPASPDGHAVTGCAATALAQVMAYYNYPLHGIGSNSYYHQVYGWISADFSQATYHWELMLDSVSAAWPLSVREAPALISYHTGVAMNMNYGPFGSGVVATQILQHMIDHFGYNPASECSWRIDYSDSAWVALLQQQLDAGYPLVYRGTSTVGHVFICDGYQDDEYFHFNWGWSGNANGYFHISNLNPLGYNFNEGNYCFRDFFPAGNYPVYCTGCDTMKNTMAIVNDGSGPVHNYLENTQCTWLIAPNTIEPTTSISLHFRYFDTDPADDSLLVFTGDPVLSEPVAGFSGNEIPEDLILSTDSVWLVFITGNNGTTGKGWELQYFTDGILVGIRDGSGTTAEFLNFYPNPATDRVYIKLPNFIHLRNTTSNRFPVTLVHQWETATLRVHDLFGRKLLEKQVVQGSAPVELDVSQWPEGMFVLQLVYQGEVVSQGKMLVCH